MLNSTMARAPIRVLSSGYRGLLKELSGRGICVVAKFWAVSFPITIEKLLEPVFHIGEVFPLYRLCWEWAHPVHMLGQVVACEVDTCIQPTLNVLLFGHHAFFGPPFNPIFPNPDLS